MYVYEFPIKTHWLKLVSPRDAIVLGAIVHNCLKDRYFDTPDDKPICSYLKNSEIGEIVKRSPQSVAYSISILQSLKLIKIKHKTPSSLPGNTYRIIYPSKLALW